MILWLYLYFVSSDRSSCSHTGLLYMKIMIRKATLSDFEHLYQYTQIFFLIYNGIVIEWRSLMIINVDWCSLILIDVDWLWLLLIDADARSNTRELHTSKRTIVSWMVIFYDSPIKHLDIWEKKNRLPVQHVIDYIRFQNLLEVQLLLLF